MWSSSLLVKTWIWEKSNWTSKSPDHLYLRYDILHRSGLLCCWVVWWKGNGGVRSSSWWTGRTRKHTGDETGTKGANYLSGSRSREMRAGSCGRSFSPPHSETLLRLPINIFRCLCGGGGSSKENWNNIIQSGWHCTDTDTVFTELFCGTLPRNVS